jgi:hypothetical protein
MRRTYRLGIHVPLPEPAYFQSAHERNISYLRRGMRGKMRMRRSGRRATAFFWFIVQRSKGF